MSEYDPNRPPGKRKVAVLREMISPGNRAPARVNANELRQRRSLPPAIRPSIEYPEGYAYLRGPPSPGNQHPPPLSPGATANVQTPPPPPPPQQQPPPPRQLQYATATPPVGQYSPVQVQHIQTSPGGQRVVVVHGAPPSPTPTVFPATNDPFVQKVTQAYPHLHPDYIPYLYSPVGKVMGADEYKDRVKDRERAGNPLAWQSPNEGFHGPSNLQPFNQSYSNTWTETKTNGDAKEDRQVYETQQQAMTIPPTAQPPPPQTTTSNHTPPPSQVTYATPYSTANGPHSPVLTGRQYIERVNDHNQAAQPLTVETEGYLGPSNVQPFTPSPAPAVNAANGAGPPPLPLTEHKEYYGRHREMDPFRPATPVQPDDASLPRHPNHYWHTWEGGDGSGHIAHIPHVQIEAKSPRNRR